MKTKDWFSLWCRCTALLLDNLFSKTICSNPRIISRRKVRLVAALLAGLCLGALTIHAQDATWSGVGGGSAFGLWNEHENWKMPAKIPTGTAIFNTDEPTSVTISLTGEHPNPPTDIGTIQFGASASAYTFTNNTTFNITSGGIANNSTSQQTFINNSLLNFEAGTAGNTLPPTIIDTTQGGRTSFFGSSTGALARFITESGGVVDISGLAATTTGMTAGSIEGAGTYNLGSKELTTGLNNLSTTVSGVIADGGAAGGTGGSLIKAGTGTLTLSGNNTYTGNTAVTAGTLLVNGSLGAGSVNVSSGATLGGTGTIGGPVTIQNGGILSPGGNPPPETPGTLTTGSLTLNSGSILNYKFGIPNVVNSGINDLVKVMGNLTLAGTLNVTDESGFEAGVYRVFDYTGSLTNNTLKLGSLPAGFGFSVDTAHAGQVNLVVSGALPDQFWDGSNMAPGSIAFGRGGNGTWNSVTTNTNWTTEDGTHNAAWGNGFAIFAGTAGTVTLGDSIHFTGMQFLTNGYLIQAPGSQTLLAAPDTIIRTDVGVTATISAPIANDSGPAKLTKSDAGILVLVGNNSYTGGTTIEDGTLQLGNGGITGSVVGDIVDDSMLAISRSDSFTFGGTISGTGSLTQIGPGTLVLTSANPYTGGTIINGGILSIATAANIGATDSLTFNGGTLLTTGNVTTPVPVILNANGTIDNGGNTDTFSGIFSGAGGLISKGAGTLILTADNEYTGDTVIAAGTLQLGNGGPTGVVVGNIQNNAALVIDHNNTVTIPGMISGSGSLTQLGPGTTILTGDNTYSGGTTISAGTLQLGSGGTTGSIIGDVTDNGTVAFNRSDTVIFPGVISGTGVVNQIGTGTTVLTGTNSYTGGTTINAGTIIIGNNSALGTGTLAMAAGTTLSWLSGNNYTIGNNITLSGDPNFASPAGTTQTLTGVISDGSSPGVLDLLGPGTLVLTGTNSYTGGTTVDAGSLYVNGDQTAATGATTVQSGATLGGTGTVGGNVTIASGGTLAPGGVGGAIGTLTINGDLGLTSGSILNYHFGQANTVGGQFNDLTVVKGNLTLAGTLNVALTPGGTFDPGIYRVISYDGALTNNGLTLGTTPAGSTEVVQTSVANQVNLVVTTGLTLNFWDGATAANKNNNRVDGGNGSWQGSSGNDNWTTDTGALNAPWTNAAFAIFQAAPGTVTVDDSVGQVTASGMQFASNGYLINGGPITLVETTTGSGQTIIRVGDGTAAGASMTATIASVLQGGTQLVKDDLGTLVLSGVNSYTGGTAINGGTLQLGDGGASGSILGNVVDNATLAFDRSNTYTFGGLISGSGILVQIGSGTTILTADNTYSGGTTISAGTLQIGNGATTGSIIGNVTDNGTLAFDRSDSVTFNGVVSGTGALVQAGRGTLILSANNTYTGGTTINTGTLQIGNGGTTGNIVGNVTDNGTLTFDRSGAKETFAGVISGGGSLVKLGSDTLELTADNTYSGGTTIESGVLVAGVPIAGQATSFALGTGDVFLNGGTLRTPSLDPLIINVGRNYTQGPGGTLALGISGVDGKDYDHVQVGGNASLNGTLAVSSLNNFRPVAGNAFEVLRTNGGRNGEFAQVNDFLNNNPNLQRIDVYAPNGVALIYVAATTPGPPVTPGVPNPRPPIIDVEPNPLPPVNPQEPLEIPSLLSILDPTAEQLTSMFEIGFSGANTQRFKLDERFDEIQRGSTGFVSNLPPAPDLVTTTATGKTVVEKQPVLQPTPENRWGVWANGWGDWVSVDNDGPAQGYNFTTGGFIVGVDFRITDHFAVGLMGGYAHTATDLQPSGNIDVNTGRGGLYATYFDHGFYIRAAAYGGHNSYNTSRQELLGPANGSTSSGEFSTWTEAGYDFHIGSFTVGPLGALQYTLVHVDGFNEQGSLLPLHIHSDQEVSLRTDLGARATYTWHLGKVLVIPTLTVAWEHEYFYSALPITADFLSIPGRSATVFGPTEGHDSAIINAGAAFQLTQRLSTYVGYQGELGRDHYNANAFTGGLSFSF
jgi:outer membrane autotransporter protein